MFEGTSAAHLVPILRANIAKEAWGVVTNLSEVPLFMDSKASRLVQLADLVAFSLYRYYEAQDSRFIDIIQGRFDKGARNLVHIPSTADWVATRIMTLGRHSVA
jgi:hypothetical protein